MADTTQNLSDDGVKVWSLHTGELGTVPHESLEAAISSGQYALPQDAQIPVVNPYGEPGTIPASFAKDAFASDYKYLTPAMQRDQELQAKYGEGLGNKLKTFGAAAARTATFGLSDEGLVNSGLSTPEALKEREARNPLTNFAGEVTGIAAPMLVAPESALNPIAQLSKAGKATEGIVAGLAPEAKSAAAKILTQAGAKATGSALEGAVFGLGQSVSEHALGDPDLNAEKVAANVGYSALLGGALGGAIGGISETAPLLKSRFPFLSKEVKEAALKDTITEDAAKAANAPAPIESAEPAAPGEPPAAAAEPAQAPTSLEELQARVKDANLDTTAQELPAKAELAAAEEQFPDSKYPAHAIQLQSLDSPRSRDVYKTFLDTGSDEAKAMRDYEALQKREAVDKAKETIQSVAPGQTLTDDEVKAGQHVVKAFTDQYQTEQKELAPFFKRFDQTAVNPVLNPGELLDKLEEAIPGVSDHLDFNGVDGKVTLRPYSPTMSLSKETYNAVKDLVTAVNEKDLTLGGLRNVRENMRDRIDWLAQPKAAKEITSLRKSLMDYIQEQVGKAAPDLDVRNVFRRYAQNEERRAIIESIFGGSISDRATFAKTIKPEDVIHRLFGNTVAVDAAKKILASGDFNKALGDYLSVQMSKATDPARIGFSSNNFGRFLRTKAPELNTAFSEDPATLNRLRAINTKMRILPDSPPVNPSGTGKAVGLLFERLAKLGNLLSPVSAAKEAAGNALKGVAEKAEAQKSKLVIDEMLKSKTAEEAEKRAEEKMVQYSILRRIEDMAQKTAGKITRGTKALFKSVSPGAAGNLIERHSKKEDTTESRNDSFEERTNQVRMWANNPDRLLDTMHSATQNLYAAAPNITAGIHNGAARAVSFLASRIPTPPSQLPLSAPWKPNRDEVNRFNRAYDAVENPMRVLDEMKNGTLSMDSLQAVQTVYPGLYNQMKSEIVDHIMATKERIPYRTRLMLGQFLGEDLDESTTPQAILANQTSFAMPSKQKDNQPGGLQPSLGGLSKLGTSGRLMTSMQTISQRES